MLVVCQGSDMLVLPLLVMGALLVAGGVCSLLLPETLNQHLPQTLEDGERFGKDHMPCCSSRYIGLRGGPTGRFATRSALFLSPTH